MRKITLSAFLLLFIFCTIGFAQDSKRDTIQIKNEIAFNVEPILFWEMGGRRLGNKTNWEIRYTHYIKRSGFRFGITYYHSIFRDPNDDLLWSYGITDSKFNYPGYYYNLINGIFPTSTTFFTDTSMSYLSSYFTKYKIIGLKGGYEYEMGKKKLKHFVGLDVNVSFLSINEQTTRLYNKKDSGSSGIFYSPSQNQLGESIGGMNSTLTRIGLLPFYGIKYPLSGHFYFSMQIGFEYYWLRGHVDYMGENNTFFSQNIKQSGFRYSNYFGLEKIFNVIYLNNISVIYRL